jgi:carbamate kinase
VTRGGTDGARRPLAVVAFGGNALLGPRDLGTVDEQKRRAEEAAGWLAHFVRRDHDLVIVHGNGPQVGQVLIQMEEAATKVPPGTLDVAVAQTQGSMGFLLETALRNRFAAEAEEAEGGSGNRGREVAIVLSLVVVDGDDPGFEEPSKPIGPFFSRWRAEQLQKDQGWPMVEDSGRGWRKVVASPRPLEVLGVDGIRCLLASGAVVIAGGGGGIPVVRDENGDLAGVEAVIDKDFTSALLARELGAELFIILTSVSQVSRDYGTDDETPLPRITLAEARRLLDDGQFPAGSMGPKVRAAMDFVAATGEKVVITDIETLPAALAGDGGTVIVRDDD